MEITINPVPSPPSGINGQICGQGKVILKAGGDPEGGDYNWYETAESTDNIGSGSEFTTPDIINTQSYFTAIENEYGCEGDRIEVQAKVNPIPERPVGQDARRCGEGEVILKVSSDIYNPTYNWYVLDSGGVAFANRSIYSASIKESTTFYVSVISGAGCESSREAVTATIDPIIPVDIGQDLALCLNSGSYDLSSDLPPGVSVEDGVFSGPGIIKSLFYPDIAGVGTHIIDFVLTSSIGCLTNGSRVITITSDGSDLTLSDTQLNICQNEGTYDLSELPSLSGGKWEGNGWEMKDHYNLKFKQMFLVRLS